MSEHKTIAQIMSEKVAALHLSKAEVVTRIQDVCSCSAVSVYAWLSGTNRPHKKYLRGIGSVLHINYNRLLAAWNRTSIAVKANSVPITPKKKQTTKHTFVPAKDNPYLMLAIELVKIGEEKRSRVLEFVGTLEKHFPVEESHDE